MPPLRDRGQDILLLAEYFLALHARRYRRETPRLSPAAEAALLRHRWPGNVRELRNGMEQALLLSTGASIGPAELGLWARPESSPAAAAPGWDAEAATPADGDLHLERTERRLIETAMARSAGNVTQAARLLGVSRDTLRYRLERLGLRGSG